MNIQDQKSIENFKLIILTKVFSLKARQVVRDEKIKSLFTIPENAISVFHSFFHKIVEKMNWIYRIIIEKRCWSSSEDKLNIDFVSQKALKMSNWNMNNSRGVWYEVLCHST